MEKDLYMGVMLHTELFYAIIPSFFSYFVPFCNHYILLLIEMSDLIFCCHRNQ